MALNLVITFLCTTVLQAQPFGNKPNHCNTNNCCKVRNPTNNVIVNRHCRTRASLSVCGNDANCIWTCPDDNILGANPRVLDDVYTFLGELNFVAGDDMENKLDPYNDNYPSGMLKVDGCGALYRIPFNTSKYNDVDIELVDINSGESIPDKNYLHEIGHYRIHTQNRGERLPRTHHSDYQKVRPSWTGSYPYNTIGLVGIVDNNGEIENFGSGTLIGGRYVLTVAHNVYNKEQGYNHFRNINNLIFIRGWSQHWKDFDYRRDRYSRIAAVYILIRHTTRQMTAYNWAILKLVDEQFPPFMSYGYFTDDQLLNSPHLHTIGMNYI